jgi:electron-transferring-flavoprotein dehydrogenase
VGAGPAGLAAAIRLRELLDGAGSSASVVVIDKAPGPGYHNLSGAAFEADSLEELLPGWQAERSLLTDNVTPVQRDDLYYLTRGAALHVPSFVVPRRMHHIGDVTISLSRLTQYLAQQATKRGVELYYGYSAGSLIVEEGVVKGVKLVDVGLDKDGRPKSDYLAGEEIRARITLLADGTHGVLSTEFGKRFGTGRNPQVYSLGIKAVVQFPGENPFGNNRVMHTLGYPAPNSVFGGGFIYSMGEKSATIGLIVGLDWKAGDLNPQREFERYRAHPFIAGLLKGSVTLATGAKTIPEGGYASLGRLSAPGALLLGDAAGFVNMEKIKGIHYAIRSGISAAETLAEAFKTDEFGERSLSSYRDRLNQRGVMADMKHARNYRQVFHWGTMAGMPLSLVQSYLPQMKTHPDHLGTKPGARMHRQDPGGMDQTTFVSLTGALHREDEPSHVTILDPAKCLDCESRFANSCTQFCPGQVYRWADSQVVLSPSNCLHCMTCSVKCPYENIRWVPPEGGEGPRFKQV